MSLFDTVQGYASLGYVCVPVNLRLDESGNKVVEAPAWKDRAFDDESDWNGYTGIAINTGASGVVAVDIDTGGEKDGFAGLDEARIRLPDTPIRATSRSGGEHRLYRRGAARVKSSSGVLARDVDIRAEGGLLFVSPTRVIEHPDQRYEWKPGAKSLPVSKLPEFPEELARKLDIRQRRPVAAPSGPRPTGVTPEQRAWGLEKIEHKLDDLAAAGPGQRNHVLGQTVTRIVGLVKTLGESMDAYSEKILEAYLRSGGDDDEQVLGWIESSIDYAEPEDPRCWLPADRERSFWDVRPELAQIRQAAFAGMASPWAVLGALCVRVLASVPPTYRIITGIGDPAGGNLNLFAVLAAESGGGKGVATQVARYLWPSDVHSVEIASGEALPKQFARRAKDPETGEWFNEQVRDSVIVDAPEFGSLSASSARQGATLMQRLCNGFSGEGLSFAVADESKNVEVRANSYRLGVITGVQYGNAGLLLSESAAVTGLPQRFVWFPANVAAEDLPEQRPAMPAPLSQWTFPAGGSQIEVCDGARHDLEAAQRAKLIGDTGSPLDGHKLYARVKLAYALAVLNGHYSSVRPEDWELSGTVLEVSDAARAKAQRVMAERERRADRKAGERSGLRKAEESNVADRLDRQVDVLRRKLQRCPDGVSRRELRKSMNSRWQAEYFEPALAQLVDTGEAAECGDSYHLAGDTQWGHLATL